MNDAPILSKPAYFGLCQVCFLETDLLIGFYRVPKNFRLPLCDYCYHFTNDRAVFPIPFGCLWPEHKDWDYMT